MRCVLASAPLSPEEQYSSFARARSSDASFGLLLLAAIAEREGVEVKVVDASAANLDINSTLKEILSFDPDIVGFSSTTPGIIPIGKLATLLKQRRPQTLTIIGGCHVSALPEDTMQTFSAFDIAVLGEGEQIFTDILREFKHGKIPGTIIGTAIRINGKVNINPPQPHLMKLDNLPFPAWHLLPGFPQAFRPSPDRYKRLPCAMLILSRGCPDRCAFCDQTVFGHKRRAYSPKYAVEMIKDLQLNYGVNEISILDSTFIANKKDTKEFCERLLAENIDISWMCHGRVNNADINLFKLMHKAGCWMIAFGIESGDQRILDAMCKRQKLADVENAVLMAKEAGLIVKGFFLLGFPGETIESLENTKLFAKKLPLDIMHVFLFTPFPGTTIFRNSNIEDHGVSNYHWQKMNALSSFFIPKGLTGKDLINTQNKMIREFYFRPRVVISHFSLAIKNPSLAWHMVNGFINLCQILLRR